ncbi:MAG: hypothetical protein SGI77_26820 [Pirellulaceae bacterium]|nr:hypothetical protein [Pirellulaceae bacterium]
MKPFRYLVVFVLLASLPSCWHREDARELRRREARTVENEEHVDTIDKAMAFLPMLLRFDRGPILRDFINQVNTWALAQPMQPGWKHSSMVDKLPATLLETDIAKRLDRIEFADLESEYLSQCKLMKDVGEWVLERPYRDPLFAPWLTQQMAKLSGVDATRLEHTMKLFDWTVRNVALEGAAKDIEAMIRDPLQPITDIGVGYRALPWQTMMVGRGDALQRTRVFSQLLFQQDIPAIQLALPDPATGATGSDRLLWCIGVPIANEIYLFEMRFGLPLPTANQAEVSTLREARTNASVLRRAKLPGWFDYPVASSDLPRLIALLDVEPFALGVGMKALEERLTGEYRMKLSMNVDEIVAKLNSIDPDLSVQLWTLPWLAQLYNRNVRSRIHDLSPFSLKYAGEYGAYMNESLVQQARMAHFRGEFDTNLDVVGAPTKYMSIRTDEGTLAKLAYDSDIQRQLHVIRGMNEKQEAFQYRIQLAQQFYRTAKLDSNAFLGFLQFDLENIDAAKDWLDNRLLKIEGTERWRAHARYLLGRCCEEDGEVHDAIEWYKYEGTPQEAGNRIRVRLLEKAESQ